MLSSQTDNKEYTPYVRIEDMEDSMLRILQRDADEYSKAERERCNKFLYPCVIILTVILVVVVIGISIF